MSTAVIVLKTVLSFGVSLKEPFRNSIAYPLISKYRAGVVTQIETELRLACHVPFGRVIWNGTFYTYISRRFSQAVASEINKL